MRDRPRLLVALWALSLAAPPAAAELVADGLRAGEPEYRELRLAAALGLLGEPLPGHQPLSRREIARLGGTPLPDPFRLERLGERVRPWTIYAEPSSVEPRWTFTPVLLVQAGWSDVRRGDEAPSVLDGGAAHAHGLAFRQRVRVAFEADAIAIGTEGRLRVDGQTADFRPDVLAVRLAWGNLRTTFGREPLSWGHAVHGNLVLSTNAQPLDQLRFESESPFRLPGPLRRLGRFHAAAFLARLDDPDRADAPFPWLVGHRFSYSPASWLVLGLNRTILTAGRGRGFAPGLESVRDLLFSQNAYASADQKVTLDWSLLLAPVAARVPGLDGGRFYGEHGGDDAFQGFPPTPSSTATLLGLELVSQGVLLRGEVARNDDDRNLWYWHWAYPDGYTVQGRVLGHPMGGDARSLYVDLEVPLGRWGLLMAGMSLVERGFHAANGVPALLLPADAPVPNGRQGGASLALERYWGGFPGALRVEARVLRESGDSAVFGSSEGLGLTVSVRLPGS